MRAIESKLLQVLQSPAATPEAKAWICRTLRVAGSEQAVPVLSPLLVNQELASDARFALRSLPGPKVDAALRQALPEAHGPLKAGIMQVLGARGDREAVSLLAPLAGDADPAVAEAALDALGHIGGEAALAALQTAPAPGSLRRGRQHALLLAAESVLAEGKTSLAAATFRSLFQQHDDALAPAALRGLVMAEKAPPELSASLTAESPVLRGVAARLINESSDAETITTVLARFGSYAPDVQIMLLGVLNHPAALPVVRTAAESPSQDIRVAALAALGRVGDASTVPLLVRSAATGAGPASAAARASLLTLRGAGVQAALLAAAETGESAARQEAVQALSGRNAKDCAGALLKLARDPDAAVRAGAIRALGTMAEAKDLPAMVSMMIQAGADRENVESALAQAALRMADADAAVTPLLEALPAATPENQAALLRVVSHVPSPKSLAALRAGLKNADAHLQDVALRGLAEWPDAAPVSDMSAILRSPSTETQRALALRGLVRMAPELGAEQTVQPMAEAMRLCQSVSEKKLVLGALAGVPSRGALELAMSCLGDRAVELEAATAVASLAKRLQTTEPAASGKAVRRMLEACTLPEARKLAESPQLRLAGMVNIAPRGRASSPDGLEKDGTASGDQAAIDGNPNTYWDETDGAKLYRLVVEFPNPERICALSIVGYQHHSFAPKDFEILCDGKAVRKITGATYEENFLALPIEEVTARTVELKITGYYGGSPAIRELGIYQRVGSEKPIRVLLFSGQNNHDWKTTTPKLESILTASGRFTVEVVERPDQCTAETFAHCDVIVCNWNAWGNPPVTNWPAATREAFLNFIRNGGGHVAVHAGASSFYDWPEYQQIGGASWDLAKTSHGAPHEFTVQPDAEHPVTRGLAPFKTTDELWRNPGIHAAAKVIATADGQPLLVTTEFGKGRGLAILLGHSAPFMETPGFQALLLRGAEWAATGNVTSAAPVK